MAQETATEAIDIKQESAEKLPEQEALEGLDSHILKSRDEGDSKIVEEAITGLEQKADELDELTRPFLEAEPTEIKDERITAISGKIDRLTELSEKVDLLLIDDKEGYDQLLAKRSEIDTKIRTLRERIEKLSADRYSPPQESDLPENSGLLTKVRFKVSSKYRWELKDKREESINSEIEGLQKQIDNCQQEVDGIQERLRSEDYRENEVATYNEGADIVRSVITFLGGEAKGISQEIKDEKNLEAKFQKEQELISILQKIDQTYEMFERISSKCSHARSSSPYVDDHLLHGINASDYLEFRFRTDPADAKMSELVRGDLVDRVESSLSDVLRRLYGEDYELFEKLLAQGNPYMQRRLYRDQRKVPEFDTMIEIEGALFGHPSNMLDRLLTTEEIDRVRKVLGRLSKYSETKDYGNIGGTRIMADPLMKIDRMLGIQEHLRGFLTDLNGEGFATHATSRSNALLVLSDGRLRSEVGAKEKNPKAKDINVSNSGQGDLIDNRTIGFSVNGVERQFMQARNPKDKSDGDGIVIAMRTKQLCSDCSWFLQENTQSRTTNPGGFELQVVDGDGVDIHNCDLFIDNGEKEYWTAKLKDLGYSEEWQTGHVHFVELRQTADLSETINGSLKHDDEKTEETSPVLPIHNGTFQDVRVQFDTGMFGDSMHERTDLPELVTPTRTYILQEK
jgi:hypothetical protein